MTLIPGERLPFAMQQVEAAIANAAEADPWLADHPPAVVWHAGVSGAETAEDHPLYLLAAETLARFGAAPRVNALHTSSDIRNPIVQNGIPTVGFGPLAGGLTMAGGADEWVDADDMQRAIAATAALVAGWCGTVPA
jgi:acetylornithine deacetylase